MALAMARASGFGSSWKLCKTSDFCRWQHPPEQSQEPLNEPCSWEKAPDQSCGATGLDWGNLWGPGAAVRKNKMGGKTLSFNSCSTT